MVWSTLKRKEDDPKLNKVTKLWDAQISSARAREMSVICNASVNVFYIIFNGHLISLKNSARTFLWVLEWFGRRRENFLDN